MAVANITVSESLLVLYTLRRADDALILGHRLSEWCGHAPMLEEDMALANIALDLLLAEQPNGDFARTIVRQFFYSAFANPYWRAMMTSADPTLAAIAARSEKESAYHLRHTSEWIVRLGDGTEESHQRTQTAIDDLWAFTGEMFAVDDCELSLIDSSVAIDPAGLRPRWLKTVSDVLGEATLALPKNDWMQQGGRSGCHTEHLGHLLSELQSMQ